MSIAICFCLLVSFVSIVTATVLRLRNDNKIQQRVLSRLPDPTVGIDDSADYIDLEYNRQLAQTIADFEVSALYAAYP